MFIYYERMKFVNKDSTWTVAQERAAALGLGLEFPKESVNSSGTNTSAVLTLPDGSKLPALARLARGWEFPVAPANDIPAGLVVIQPYINPKMSERYRDRGLFYLDLAGNAWIWTNTVKIHVAGQKPEPEQRPVTQRTPLSTPSALRVIFVLLNDPETAKLTLRELADLAAISLGATQKAIRALKDQGFLDAQNGDLRRLGELTDLWLTGFGERLLPSIRSRAVSGKTPSEVLQIVEGKGLNFIPAGEAVSPTMHSMKSVTLYDTPPWTEIISEARLKPDEMGNITLRERFWNNEALELTEAGHTLLTCGELLASTDERLREAGAVLREALL